jgi:hypothetical protein
MPNGICKLCLLDKTLVRSHLMPAALYGYCRAAGTDPIKVGEGVVMPTSRQTQAHLLCQACEEVLNKNGENWVNPRLATTDGEFPLYTIVSSHAPQASEDGALRFLAAKNPGIDVTSLTHFAMGIFWKASVHSWKGHTLAPRIELGPYSEEIRKWLRGASSFPRDSSLAVLLSPPSRVLNAMSDPIEGVRQQWRSHFFYVFGVLFVLNVGREIAPEVRSLCLYQNSDHPILVSEDLTARIERLFAGTVHGSRETNALRALRAKRAAWRKDNL